MKDIMIETCADGPLGLPTWTTRGTQRRAYASIEDTAGLKAEIELTTDGEHPGFRHYTTEPGGERRPVGGPDSAGTESVVELVAAIEERRAVCRRAGYPLVDAGDEAEDRMAPEFLAALARAWEPHGVEQNLTEAARWRIGTQEFTTGLGFELARGPDGTFELLDPDGEQAQEDTARDHRETPHRTGYIMPNGDEELQNDAGELLELP